MKTLESPFIQKKLSRLKRRGFPAVAWREFAVLEEKYFSNEKWREPKRKKKTEQKRFSLLS
jgi:hypothetical protein